MVKLTTELIEQAVQWTNPATRDRELDLRGYKIPVIENLGATLDQYDCLDLSDNDIRKLDGFPLLPRIKTLLLNNNRIVRVGDNLELSLPNLEWLVLTNNALQELEDLDALSSIKNLRHLSLLRNPVTTKKYYRLYTIWKVPQLTRLDFRRIRQIERDAASRMFKGKRGKEFATELSKRRAAPQAALAEKKPLNKAKAAEIESIKKAIANATSLEEVERLKQMLAQGQVPASQDFQGHHEATNSHQPMETGGP